MQLNRHHSTWRGHPNDTGQDREAEERRTSSHGRTELRWVDAPEPETWSDWSDTGQYRGSLESREKEQERFSNYGRRQTRWVPDY